MILMALYGCAAKSVPEKTAQRFIDAFNAYDLEVMIDCMEPSQAKAYKALIKFGDDVTDIDLTSLMRLGPLMENESKIEYEIIGSSIDGNHATVEVEDSEHGFAELDLVLIDANWYLSE